MRRALCMLLPSRREGYGMVVVEAAAHGTPSVVVAGEDNAATELIEEGVNGIVAAARRAEDAGRGDRARVHGRAGAARRARPPGSQRNAEQLSLEHSLRTVLEVYDEVSARRVAREREPRRCAPR